jgi:hypothetical protein
MAPKPTRSRPHAECRHLSQVPMFMVEEVEQRLLYAAASAGALAVPHPGWASVRERVSLRALVEGRPATQCATRRGSCAIVRDWSWGEAFRHRPVWPLDMEDAAAHDQRLATELMAALPVRGLLVCDLGFCSGWWFEHVTDQQTCFVTRGRAKLSYRTGPVLSQSAFARDAMLQVGRYRSHPC